MDPAYIERDRKSIYIFALYWIFEVITTVGYGEFTGKCSIERLFSVIVMFIGVIFCSFLMG
jgi:hypothetical protein